MDETPPAREQEGATRRDLMRQAACLAGACAAGAWPAPAISARPAPSYARAQIVDAQGGALTTRQLAAAGTPWIFNYPYAASPAFLIALDAPPAATELATEAQRRYSAPAGVGPQRSIVAFSAICAHKLVYPTPQISFIGLRAGQGDEPGQVIHCCGDQSRYDPTHGARVIGGPAPQPLAAVLLEWDPKTDQLYAIGVRGGDRFEAFFDKYGFKLEMELGARARALAGATATAKPASAYSRQWQSCRA